MFVCEECHGATWKTFRSFGRCEICGKTKPCIEVSSHKIATTRDDPETKWETGNVLK